MTQAVVQIQGHQFLTKEGEEIITDRYAAKKGEEIELEPLLYFDEKTVKVGTPVLEDVVVVGKILEHLKGKKIRVAKFRAKSRYRRVKGFRPLLTRIKIKKITLRKKKDG